MTTKWYDKDGNLHEIVRKDLGNGRGICDKFVNGKKYVFVQRERHIHPTSELEMFIEMRDEVRALAKSLNSGNDEDVYAKLLACVDKYDKCAYDT